MAAVVAGAVPGSAQHAPAWYVTAHAAAVHYYGDLAAGTGAGAGLEAGRRLSSSFATALALRQVRYGALDAEGRDADRATAALLLRYAPMRVGRLHPVLTAGLHVTEGTHEAVFGPVAGAGMEASLQPRLAVALDVLVHLAVPDAAFDGARADHLGGLDRRYQLDVLTHATLGLRLAL